MVLIIMRHSICYGLDNHIINGWKDFPLTEEGLEEIRCVAKKIPVTSIDKVYSSYISRAYDTANNLLKELNIPLTVNKDIRLNERHYGFFQGMPKEKAATYKEYNTLSDSSDALDNSLIPMSDKEYDMQLEEYSKKLNISKDKLKLPKAESILDVEKRLNEFLSQEIFIPENENNTILIVGHANTVKLAVKYIEKLTFEETSKLRFATCGMRIYQFESVNSKYIIKNVQNINKEWVN